MANTANLNAVPLSSESDVNKVTVLNALTNLLDKAIAGYSALAPADGNYTLTSDEARQPAIKFTTAFTAARAIKIPIDAGTGRNRLILIWNATGQTITIKTTAGGSTGIDISNGSCRAVWHDGTNVYAIGPEVSPTTGLVLPSAINAVGACAYNNGSISIPDTTVTALTFDSERWDTSSIHSTSSDTGRLTFPYAGKWLISGTVRWAANGNGIRGLLLKINGSTQIGYSLINNAGGSLPTVHSVVREWVVAAGDYALLYGQQTSGGALNIELDSAYSPEFWCEYRGS